MKRTRLNISTLSKHLQENVGNQNYLCLSSLSMKLGSNYTLPLRDAAHFSKMIEEGRCTLRVQCILQQQTIQSFNRRLASSSSSRQEDSLIQTSIIAILLFLLAFFKFDLVSLKLFYLRSFSEMQHFGISFLCCQCSQLWI